MNETSIVPAEQIENHLIYFTPPEKCHYCDRWSTIALLDNAFHPMFSARCALHGYASAYSTTPTPREQADERTSVARFVVWMYCEQGSVPLITSIEADQVPGYVVDTDPFAFEPMSWFVRYEQPDGVRVDLHVIWDISENQFFLYRDGQLVSERHEEVLS